MVAQGENQKERERLGMVIFRTSFKEREVDKRLILGSFVHKFLLKEIDPMFIKKRLGKKDQQRWKQKQNRGNQHR